MDANVSSTSEKDMTESGSGPRHRAFADTDQGGLLLVASQCTRPCAKTPSVLLMPNLSTAKQGGFAPLAAGLQ
jgi:hypothetical protein